MSSPPTAVVLWALLGCSVALSGCVASHGSKALSREPSPWSTADGRTATRLNLAATLLDMGQVRQALDLVMLASQEVGQDLELDILRARCLMALGMFAEAEAALEPHLDWHGANAELQRVLGLLHFDQQQYQQAEDAFRKAIRLAPSNPAAHNNLGFLLMVQGRNQEALEQFQLALDLRPTFQRARNNQGFVLAALGRDEDALRAFSLAGSDSRAMSNMGLACERRGDKEQAANYYRQALQLDPRLVAAREALHRLGVGDSPNQEQGAP